MHTEVVWYRMTRKLCAMNPMKYIMLDRTTGLPLINHHSCPWTSSRRRVEKLSITATEGMSRSLQTRRENTNYSDILDFCLCASGWPRYHSAATWLWHITRLIPHSPCSYWGRMLETCHVKIRLNMLYSLISCLFPYNCMLAALYCTLLTTTMCNLLRKDKSLI